MEKDLIKIYKRLKKILKKYEKPLISKMDLDSKYDLWSIKDVEFAGRKRNEVFFAGLIIQSKYVGFYYMPVYVDTSLKEVFKPELLKLLKGKSCFHIKSLDDKLEKQIDFALKKGYAMYKKRGWV
ncbi:MAG: DUF1801 domain-containing protein [Ignavibacteria bacterium]|nr:DUF1801 domain-containing protein [Ignavibacteria bacterium]